MGTAATVLPADLASVTYTMAASASPVVTAARVAFTSAPRVIFDGSIVTPAPDRIWSAYLPHGTVVPQSETTPRLARSANVFTFFGLQGLTTIVSRFDANTVGSAVTCPPVTSFCMLAPSAEANTSAGAPPWICCARVDDAAKLKVTVVPLLIFSKSLPIFVKASVSEAAADTVIDPLSFGVFAFAAPA